MHILNLKQGSPEWHAHRATKFNASDAPAMLGESPYCSRTQLIQRMATGIVEEVDESTQHRFDKGHAVEALLRPFAEQSLGEPLHAFVGVADFDERLSASFDGCTFVGDVTLECKLLNARLREAFADMETIAPEFRERSAGKSLPIDYRIQMEQQLRVAQAERCLFMTGELRDDGTLGNVLSCWYYPDDALWDRIVAGWPQLEADVAAYAPSNIKEMPTAEVTLALPALFIHAKGEITTSNMKEYGEALAARLEEIRAIKLVTDQDFSNAKESAKMLRENREKALLAKDAMLAQTVTVGEAANMIDAWCEDMRLTALQLEKDVEREDKAKKAAMIDAAKVKYAEHIQGLEREINPARISLPVPVFAEAIKGKRNFASMQDAVDTMLAAAKIAANDMAATIRFNRDQLRPVEGEDWITLFPDFAAVCAKPRDDFHNLMTARVAAHSQRLEAERERIRQEEQAKAEKAAREKLAAEQREQEARDRETARQAQAALQQEADRRRAAGELDYPEALEAAKAGTPMQCRRFPQDLWCDRRAGEEMTPNLYYRLAEKPVQPPAPTPIAPPAVSSQAIAANSPNVVPIQRPTPAPASPPTLRLGQINDRFRLIGLTADGLTNLGFPPAATEKAAKLYHEADFSRICDSIVAHVRMVQDQYQRQVA